VLAYIDVVDASVELKSTEEPANAPFFKYLIDQESTRIYSIYNTCRLLRSLCTEEWRVDNLFGCNEAACKFSIVIVNFGLKPDPTKLLAEVQRRRVSLDMLTAAAINPSAIAVCGPDQYQAVLAGLKAQGHLSEETRKRYAKRALRYIAHLCRTLTDAPSLAAGGCNG